MDRHLELFRYRNHKQQSSQMQQKVEMNIESSSNNLDHMVRQQKPINSLKGKLDYHLQKYKRQQEQQMNGFQMSSVFNTGKTRNVKKNNRYSDIQQNMLYQSELTNSSFIDKIHKLHKQSQPQQKEREGQREEEGIFQTPVTTKFIQKNQKPEQSLEERLKQFELKIEFKGIINQQNKQQQQQRNDNQDVIEFIKKVKNLGKKYKKIEDNSVNRNNMIERYINRDRINNNELVEILENEEERKRILIIDCRFDYEFKGGHIEGGVNISSPKQLQSCILDNLDILSEEYIEMLKQLQSHLVDYDLSNQDINYRQIFIDHYKQDYKRLNRSNLMVIMHCEFSRQRSPQMMSHFQKVQGHNGVKVLLLTKGYDQFVEKYGHRCTPKDGYISMFNKKRQQQKINKEQQYHQQWGQVELIRSQSTRNQ